MNFRISLLLPGLALGLSACAMNPPPAPDRASLHPAPALSPGTPHDVADKTAPLTLEGAIEAALLNNPKLRAEYARFEALLHEVPQASSLPDPMAMVSQMEAFRGPMNERENMLTVSQTFPWFGKRNLRGSIARTEAFEALEEYRMSALEMRRDVSRAWHMLRYEKADLELTRQDRELVAETLQSTISLYEVGRVDRSALLRTQTEHARVETDLAAIESRIETFQRELHRLMGIEKSQPGHAFDPEAVEHPEVPGTQTLLTEAINHRPELDQYRRREEAGRLAEKLARRDYYPDITLGAGVVAMGERGGEFYSPTSDERTDSWQASAGINIPIPNARRRAATQQARKRVEEAALRGKDAANVVVEEIHSTSSQLMALRTQHELFRDNLLPLAEEAFEATDAGYRVGLVTYADMLDAQRMLITAQRDALRIDRDHHLAIVDLERAVGIPFHLIPTSEEHTP